MTRRLTRTEKPATPVTHPARTGAPIASKIFRASIPPSPTTSRSSSHAREHRPLAAAPASQSSGQLLGLLQQLPHTPALAFGPFLDILAWNQLAAALLVDFAEVPPERRNYVRLLSVEAGSRGCCSTPLAATNVARLLFDQFGSQPEAEAERLVHA